MAQLKEPKAELNQWRTVAGITILAGGMFGGLLLSHPTGEILEKMYANMAWSFTTFAAFEAGKAAIQHVSNNGGLKNLVKGMIGEKPEEKPVEEKPEETKP